MIRHFLIIVTSVFLFAPFIVSAQTFFVACTDLKNDLKYKSSDTQTNGEVTLLQRFLQSGGYIKNSPTGYFGTQTLSAVKSFQKAYAILSTGYVGPETRLKIKTLTCPKTKPTISSAALPSTVFFAGGTQVVAKVKISADASGPLVWRKVVYRVSTSTPGRFFVTNYEIFEGTSTTPLPDTSVIVTTTATSTYGWTETVSFVSDSDQTIPAGESKTYTVKAFVSGFRMSGSSVSLHIPIGQTTAVAPNTYAAVASLNPQPTFIWSDKSHPHHSATSTDWLGDYFVAGLPTNWQTLYAMDDAAHLKNLASILTAMLEILAKL